jgi:LCP family protein required for cell wall assembly
MKTTLKRGIGRGSHVNGNGRAVFPPGTVSAITRYSQPPPRRRSGLGLVGRILLIVFLVLVSLALGLAGGAYLWFHREVAAVQAHSADVKRAQKQLTPAAAGQPAIALVLGYDARKGADAGGGSRSDTLMLIRADPTTHTISLLSFPRDLEVPIYCPNSPDPITTDKINSAYDRCQATGTLETVKHLTGLSPNYLITVNFHGFKEIVDDMHGVWLFVDRRYYNKNVGTSATDFANINLQPGYQRLTGGSALEFVRYRHTDSDFVRLARQQEFVRALKDQLSQHVSVFDLPKIVSAITSNVEVGGHPSDQTVLSYAWFALTLQGGHVIQDTIQNVNSTYSSVTAPQSSIDAAVQQFTHPDIGVSKAAAATAVGKKPKTAGGAPPPSKTSVTVLNGNAVPGSAGEASGLLAQRGYFTVLPPNGQQADAPTETYFHSQVLYDPAKAGAKAAAAKLATLMAPADVATIPKDPALRALDPGSMILVITGQTFHNQLSSSPPTVTQQVPVHVAPSVRNDPGPGHELLDPLVKKIGFPLQVPTVLESTSYPDTIPGDVDVRPYAIYQHYKAVTLVFRTGGGLFWDIQETNWPDPPILDDKSFQHDLGGREFSEYWNGPHLHMIVLRVGNNSYWVVNTLQDDLSNETMIAIAKGLKPMARK